jgi:hypothetical protein
MGCLLFFVEIFAKRFQLWYIKRHITLEKISDKVLAFHPLDYRKVVEQGFSKRLEKYAKEI